MDTQRRDAICWGSNTPIDSSVDTFGTAFNAIDSSFESLHTTLYAFDQAIDSSINRIVKAVDPALVAITQS